MLFKLEDIKENIREKPKRESWMIEEDISEESTYIYNPNLTLQEIFSENILEGKLYTLFSDGQWSQYELVDHLLKYTGQGSKLYFSTWAMSELSARILATWLAEGRLSELWGVLDIRSKTRHPSSFDIARTSFDKIKTTSCHAKVTVIVPADAAVTTPHICVIGSSNWTQNPRKECVIVINSRQSAMEHMKWIKDIVLENDQS